MMMLGFWFVLCFGSAFLEEATRNLRSSDLAKIELMSTTFGTLQKHLNELRVRQKVTDKSVANLNAATRKLNEFQVSWKKLIQSNNSNKSEPSTDSGCDTTLKIVHLLMKRFDNVETSFDHKSSNLRTEFGKKPTMQSDKTKNLQTRIDQLTTQADKRERSNSELKTTVKTMDSKLKQAVLDLKSESRKRQDLGATMDLNKKSVNNTLFTMDRKLTNLASDVKSLFIQS